MSAKLEPRLIIHTGPMFSAKTMNLIAQYRLFAIGGHKPIAFRPAKDTRDSSQVIRTRFGDVSIPAQTIASSREIRPLVKGVRPVFIDEAQFFDEELPEVVGELLYKMPVIIAGLDLDFRGEPFGTMPRLMALAQQVHKYTALCGKCAAQDASRSQRLRNGVPSQLDEPDVLPEGKEAAVTYEPRCVKCFVRVT